MVAGSNPVVLIFFFILFLHMRPIIEGLYEEEVKGLATFLLNKAFVDKRRADIVAGRSKQT